MQLYTRILIGMVLGVLLGFVLGPNSMLLPHDGLQWSGDDVVLDAPSSDASPNPLARATNRARIVRDVGDGFAEVAFRIDANRRLRLIDQGVTEANDVSPGERVTGFVQTDQPTVRRYARIGQTLIDATSWIGDLFLALIKMVVVPLVFASLVVGVASLGDFRKLGRLGARTLLLFTGTTLVALTIGVGLANLVGPGSFMTEADRAQLLASYQGDASSTVASAAAAPSLIDQVIGIVPTNPLSSLANGDMLQIIFFGLMLGVALTLLPTKRAKPVVDFLDGLNEAMVMLVHVAMALAPYGVAALLFKVVGSTGLSVLAALSVYAIVVVAALALHAAITYGTLVTFGARLGFLGFLGAIRPAILLAFSTSSSSATLPVTKECVEDNVNVSPEVSSFVLPLGATVNMDGTALYQGVAAIFIAQIYSIDLSLGDQITIVTSATLASVGAAGVPGAGMITLALVLTAIGVPTEGLALVLGVDRLLDMFRTATNVIGDATAATWMARLEGNPIEVVSPEADRADPHRGFEGRLDDEPRPVRVDATDEPSSARETGYDGGMG